jgi:hypothetical protein
MQVRKLLEWRSAEYDGRVQSRTVLLADLQRSKIVLFTSYALAELALPAYSFFLTLLENYGLQLDHLTPHAITLVAIFAHFYKMYVGIRPSMCLFWLFFMLRASGRSQTHLGAYYFYSRSKSSTPYIAPPPLALANGTVGGRTG